MSLLKLNTLDEIVTVSGKVVNLKTKVNQGLIGEVRAQALEELAVAYETKKNELINTYTYDRYLKNTENNLNQIVDNSFKKSIRSSISNKLEELANERINTERDFSFIYRIFHKIGQLFKGRGFRTKGEWGLELARRIKGEDLDTLKTKLRPCLDGSPGAPSLMDINDEINALDENDFKKILKDVVFKRNLNSISSLIRNSGKMRFFKNLDDDKKKIFKNELSKRDDWFSQIIDMMDRTEYDELDLLYHPDMVEKFEQSRDHLSKSYEKSARRSPELAGLFHYMLAKTIHKYLDDQNLTDLEKYTNIGRITGQPLSDISKSVVNDENLFNDAERTKLKGNVRNLQG